MPSADGMRDAREVVPYEQIPNFAVLRGDDLCSTVGVDGLAAARSRHGSECHLGIHSLPCRRFATSAPRKPPSGREGDHEVVEGACGSRD